jgi:uncharacterized protein YvpB
MKSHKKKLTVMIFSLLILGLLLFLYADRQNLFHIASVNANITVTNEQPTSDASTNFPKDTVPKLSGDKHADLPTRVLLDVPFIDQNPELPTGCEVTSLTEVLNYLNFDVDKEYLAENYLDIRYEVEDGCFVKYFLGSPWSPDGSGCFAPAIVRCANAYLEDQGSKLRAKSISYSPIHKLFKELAKGNPVIVWTSYDYDQPEVGYTDVEITEDEVFGWPDNEHCVVLCGYNLSANTITLADPTYGIVEHSIEEFSNYYPKYYYQAVIIE